VSAFNLRANFDHAKGIVKITYLLSTGVQYGKQQFEFVLKYNTIEQVTCDFSQAQPIMYLQSRYPIKVPYFHIDINVHFTGMGDFVEFGADEFVETISGTVERERC
jgi:hypothetical protein